MKKIEKFILPEHTNTLYEKEAISSISLTKEVADKINELVDGINALSTTDLVWKQEQEGTIRKAIVYIKDNLLNTLHELTEIYEKNGLFSSYVNKYTKELETRLNNLLTGETTDGELLDLRVGANGVTYETAGESIRDNIKNLIDYTAQLNKSILDSLIVEGVELLDLNAATAKTITAGGIITDIISGDKNFLVSSAFTVKAGEKYIITGSAMKEQYIYAFYNKDNIFVGGLVASDFNKHSINKNYGYLSNELIIIPPGVAKMRICGNTGVVSPVLKKVTSSSHKNAAITNWLNNISNIIVNNQFEYEDELKLSYLTNTVLEKDGVVTTTEFLSNDYLVSNAIPVKPGEIYHITGSAHYAKSLYALYDGDEQPIKYEVTEDKSTFEILDKDIFIPYGVSYLRVACSTNSKYFDVKKAVGFKDDTNKEWLGVKWVAFGDSLTESNYRARKQYHDYIKEDTGITVLNHGKSGSGFARSENAWHSRILELANVDFDIITFFGSGNDLNKAAVNKELGTATDTGTATIAGCINTTLENLFNIKPLVKVGIITPTPWVNQTPKENNCYMEQYSNLLVDIAKKWSIPVLDLYHTSTLQPDSQIFRNEFYNEEGVQDEGVHPNSKGHKRFYPQIKEFLKTII